MYIYMRVCVYREYSTGNKLNFISKSFLLCLYQLHIYNEILLQLSNLQIVFLTDFDFSLLQKREYQYKKNDKKTVVTKLREARLTVTNHNPDKSN